MGRWTGCLLVSCLLVVACSAGSGSTDAVEEVSGSDVGVDTAVDVQDAADAVDVEDVEAVDDVPGGDLPLDLVPWDGLDEDVTPTDALDSQEGDSLEEDLLNDVADVEEMEDQWEDVPLCPTLEELEEPRAWGTVYLDPNCSSDSFYSQNIIEGLDEVLPGHPVRLTDGVSTVTTQTCPDGTYSFPALEDGLYVVQGEVPAEETLCSSANQAPRFFQAVEEGHVRIVTFGDSIPIYGPQPPFPTRLADLLSPLVEVDNVNLAQSGSTTSYWMPDGSHFQNQLAPALPGTDVVIISLGGNDLEYAMYGDFTGNPEQLLEIAAQFPELVDEIQVNLQIIIAAIKEIVPEADIVYIVYPNYAKTAYWKDYAGDYIGLVNSALTNAFGEIKETMSDLPGMTLVDMFKATANEDLDLYLSDPLHLSEAGTYRWAEEIFVALGGVRISQSPLGLHRDIGFAPPDCGNSVD